MAYLSILVQLFNSVLPAVCQRPAPDPHINKPMLDSPTATTGIQQVIAKYSARLALPDAVFVDGVAPVAMLDVAELIMEPVTLSIVIEGSTVEAIVIEGSMVEAIVIEGSTVEAIVIEGSTAPEDMDI
ncbi:hypothetical protein LTR99_010992 [Exophiala xenobiotica]|uniref:Uncharacterized protein n=1 Tax=Vermiconidia calcicola TaxID=1690605 RepID=A0AAV9PTG3_9PEZI|nr:hypothetical protein LTR41_011545 [Exophiala xenobiotica]KAK5527739.1 hypothetical protein LTR25_010940 [Vermiconidia calcicola]KAK5531207.1 hypothetical protein LTR23_010031 [Chaetothyriales sp. CCFEE 6169]KAK5245481.1 hypothetical protein LTS06_009105 [Exophiala xenobiotica]KAK5291021.1 hypothetical protein LTR99_010992 [Exophiala xenobiotica]